MLTVKTLNRFISIHVPREGDDRSGGGAGDGAADFNPRPP